MTTERTWLCECGQFKVKLIGEPTVSLVCHCHSCVAPIVSLRCACNLALYEVHCLIFLLHLIQHFIDEKRKDKGASALKDHGAAESYFRSSQIMFPEDLEGKLSFVKVGDRGWAGRSFTTCCTTQVTNVVLPKCIAFTTNFIKNQDGTSYMQSSEVMHCNKKFSFDPKLVPEHCYNTCPVGFIFTFLGLLLNPFEPSLKKHKDLFPDPLLVETVPITW